MELLLVHLTDIHIRDDADFEVLSERIDSIGGAICTHMHSADSNRRFCGAKRTRCGASGLLIL